MPISGISGANYYVPLSNTVNSSQSQGGTDLQHHNTQIEKAVVPSTKIKNVDEISPTSADEDAKIGTLLNVKA
ncbi:MAG TPA: hypothetical protein VFQ90_13250 [Stellaceae bacterium]|jgi:hypothetical protein|nr:hypothetical protein [Stellaceae bacterium]